MKFFGHCRGLQLKSIPNLEREHLLVEKGVFELIHSIPIGFTPTLVDLKNLPQIPVPSHVLKEEFYLWFTHTFEGDIMIPYYQFWYDFNQDRLGLPEQSIRELGLLHFNALLNRVLPAGVHMFRESSVESGYPTIENVPRLSVLDQARSAWKSNAARSFLLWTYLEGQSSDHIEFESDAKEYRILIKESAYRIIHSINERFGFEDYEVSTINNAREESNVKHSEAAQIYREQKWDGKLLRKLIKKQFANS